MELLGTYCVWLESSELDVRSGVPHVLGMVNINVTTDLTRPDPLTLMAGLLNIKENNILTMISVQRVNN